MLFYSFKFAPVWAFKKMFFLHSFLLLKNFRFMFMIRVTIFVKKKRFYCLFLILNLSFLLVILYLT